MKKLLPLALCLLCLPAHGGLSFIRGTFFSIGRQLGVESILCDPALFLSIPYTNVPNPQTWLDGGFQCQKISNSSPVDIRIKSLSFQCLTNASNPAPLMTGRVRSNPNLGAGYDYGHYSISTNQSRDGVYFDLNWENGKEPTVPALTDFYIGATISGSTATKIFVRLGVSQYYLDGNYTAYNNGVALANADYYLDIYTCP